MDSILKSCVSLKKHLDGNRFSGNQIDVDCINVINLFCINNFYCRNFTTHLAGGHEPGKILRLSLTKGPQSGISWTDWGRVHLARVNYPSSLQELTGFQSGRNGSESLDGVARNTHTGA